MKSAIWHFLVRPFPQTMSYWHYLKWAVAWGVYTFLIIHELQPLVLKTFTYPNGQLLWLAITYALCVMMTNFGINVTTILICDKLGIKIEEDWTVLHQIVISWVHIVTIFAVVFIMGEVTVSVFHRPEIGKNEFYPFLGKLCLIGVGIYFAVEYYTRVRFYNNEAKQFNEWARQESLGINSEINADAEVVLHSEDDRLLLRLWASQLYLVEAEGNYVMVYWKEKDGKMEKTLIRLPIGKVENLLSPFAHFFRCHRSYIINLQEVRSIEGNSITGNARGLQIKLTTLHKEIPVARNRIVDFRMKVHNLFPVTT